MYAVSTCGQRDVKWDEVHRFHLVASDIYGMILSAINRSSDNKNMYRPLVCWSPSVMVMGVIQKTVSDTYYNMVVSWWRQRLASVRCGCTCPCRCE